MTGTRRTSKARKLLQGTYRADRDHSPATVAGIPACDARLSDDVKATFEHLIELLKPLRTLAASDGPALELAAHALSEHRQAAAVIARLGPTYEAATETGSILTRVRPEVAIVQDAWRRASQMLAAFGLRPDARARVDAAPLPVPENKFRALEARLAPRPRKRKT